MYSKVIQLCVCVCVCVSVYIYFFILFSIMVYHRLLNIVPCATQQDLVVYPSSIVCICPKHPILSFPSPPTLVTKGLFCMSVSLSLFHRYVHLYCILDSTYKWYVFEWSFSFWSLKSLLPLIKRDKRNICSFSLSTLLSMWRDGK